MIGHITKPIKLVWKQNNDSVTIVLRGVGTGICQNPVTKGDLEFHMVRSNIEMQCKQHRDGSEQLHKFEK